MFLGSCCAKFHARQPRIWLPVERRPHQVLSVRKTTLVEGRKPSIILMWSRPYILINKFFRCIFIIYTNIKYEYNSTVILLIEIKNYIYIYILLSNILNDWTVACRNMYFTNIIGFVKKIMRWRCARIKVCY